MDALEIVGKNIKRLRLKAGFSQEVFAERAGLHRTYVGGIERGERNVSVKNLEKIAEALKVQTHLLLVRPRETSA